MTLQSYTNLSTTITTNLADNTTGGISASDHRTVENNLLDGIWKRVSSAIDNTDSPYTVNLSNTQILLADPTSGAITVNLPAVTSSTGAILTVKNIGTTNAVTLDGNASETIDGATTKALSTQYDVVTVFCDGTEWHIIAN
jgi:hypothetical protein